MKTKNQNIISTVLLFLLVFQVHLSAQHEKVAPTHSPEPKFEHLTIEDGLSQNHVNKILKDSRGFIWFCTQNGLNRYDGKSFKIYKHSPIDTNSLSSNYIEAICEDRNGNLWIGTYGGGLNKFERKTEKFNHYRHDPVNNNSISSDFILSVYEDKSGLLWIGTNGSALNKFDMNEETFIHYSNDPVDSNTLINNTVRAFYEDNSGVLWIGTSEGLNKFDKKTEKFTRYKNDLNNPKGLSDGSVVAIIEDEDKVLWIATYGGGLNMFDRETETFTHYKHDPKNPNSLAHDVLQSIFKSPTESGVIWIATSDGGIDKYYIKENKFTHYKYKPYDPTSLSTNRTLTIYEDDSGILWIGTADKGLNKYNKAQDNILHYKNDPSTENSLSAHPVRDIYEDKSGILWIGTHGGGLYKFDRKSGDYIQYVHQPDDLNSLSHNTIHSITAGKPGILWIGTLDGLNRFDTRKNIFTIYKHDHNNLQSLSSDFVSYVYTDRSGNIWIGTFGGGVNKLVINENDNLSPVFLHYQHDPNDPHSLSDNSVLTICEDNDGFLWIGTFDGLNKFDTRKSIFTIYKYDPKSPNSLSNDHVSTIYQDKNGVMWIGTSGGGLNKLVPGDDEESPTTFIHYREIDGLSNNFIVGILEDEHHNLWISTKNGLSKFNPNEVDDKGIAFPSVFKNYFVHDGLMENEFKAAYFKNSKGEMFFGASNGFNAFYPDNLKENLTIPAIVITGFKVFNEDYKLDTSITEINQFDLSYNENFISFDFAVLDYTVPNKNNYAYKLDGLDNDWNYVDNRNFAQYTDLSPGDYVFKVKGSNSDGIWNENPTMLKIIILPPWWQTWWAYSSYLILLLILLYSLRRYELSRVNLKNKVILEATKLKEREQVDQMKSTFFTNISHEFRTPLTLILGPLNKLVARENSDNDKRSLQIMQRNAERLLRLINQLLDFSRLESGKMNLQASKSDIVSFVKGLLMSFQTYAEQKKIKYRFTTGHDKIDIYFDRDKMEKVIVNLLSNAFKFTPEHGGISVQIRQVEDSVIIIFEDSGVGIGEDKIDHIFDRFYQVDGSLTKDQEGTGIGLALTKELIELHQGKISVESVVGRGTKFAVMLPSGKDHLNADEIVAEDLMLTEDAKHQVAIDDVPASDSFMDNKSSKTIILVVEDNPDMHTYIRDTLHPDYQVKEAYDGEEGVELAKDIIPDLIISDLMMPKKDGYQLCSELKQDDRTSHIPVILLTAKAKHEDKLMGLQVGADDYLVKPFDSKELQIRIKNLIEIRRNLQAAFRNGNVQVNKVDDNKELINPVDQRFMERVMELVKVNLANEQFDIKQFSKEIGMSGTQLRRKMNALTGLSPNQFQRSIRLQEAGRLIREEQQGVSEAAYKVGFNSLSYFSKCFQEQFGILPSDY